MNPTNRETKKSHKVPQFILKNFASRSKHKINKTKYFIYCFHKLEEKAYELSLSDACAENKFYETILDKDMVKRIFGEDILQENKRIAVKGIEQMFSKLEDKAAPVIEKIVKDKSINDLKVKHKTILASFVAFQYLRTDYHKNNLRKIAASDKEKRTEIASVYGVELPKNEYDEMSFYADSEEGGKLLHSDSLLDKSLNKRIFLQIINKEWVLFEASRNNPFIIGDNPVVLHNDNKDYGFLGNLGLACKGIEIYFPLSSRLALGFLCPSIIAKIEESYKKEIDKLDSKISHYVPLCNLGKDDSIKIKSRQIIEKLEEKKKYLFEFKKETELMQSSEIVNLGDERVIRLNCLQIAFSSRFIFSSKNDFSLVKRMIKDDPSFKSGVGIRIG